MSKKCPKCPELNYLNQVKIYLINPPIHPYIHPQVGVSPQIINFQGKLNYVTQVKIYSIFNDLPRPHPFTYSLTNPSNQPTIHPAIGGGGGISTNHKSSNRIEIPQLGQDLFDFQCYDPTLPIKPPIGGGVSINHKSSNRIELSQLGQDLFNFQ